MPVAFSRKAGEQFPMAERLDGTTGIAIVDLKGGKIIMPKPGDISVCVESAELQIFDDRAAFRTLSARESGELIAHKKRHDKVCKMISLALGWTGASNARE